MGVCMGVIAIDSVRADGAVRALMDPHGQPARDPVGSILWVSATPLTNEHGEDILRRNDYAVRRLATSAEGWSATDLGGADVVILEIPLADDAGLALCRRLSDSQPGAVLVLAPRIGALERVAILEFGADVILPHSTHPLELLACVRALVRRAARGGRAVQAQQVVEWRFEVATGRIRSNTGRAVHLTAGDAELLRALAAHSGELVDRHTLVELLHDSSAGASARSIDARVARLRRALEPCDGVGDIIRTVRGKGYILEPSKTFHVPIS